jgi:hypothetical protein
MAVSPIHIWAGFSTGKIAIYDMSSEPLMQLKEFQAYSNSAIQAFCKSENAILQSSRYSIFSLSENGDFLEWDGYMIDDYIGMRSYLI